MNEKGGSTMKTELEKKLEQINRNKKVQSYEKTEEPIGL